MKINIFVITMQIFLLCSCSMNSKQCIPTQYQIIDGYVNDDDSSSYDIEFKDFDKDCVSDTNVKLLIQEMIRKKEFDFPISMVRCFKDNGDGVFDELFNPLGLEDLFLIIEGIESTGKYDHYSFYQYD